MAVRDARYGALEASLPVRLTPHWKSRLRGLDPASVGSTDRVQDPGMGPGKQAAWSASLPERDPAGALTPTEPLPWYVLPAHESHPEGSGRPGCREPGIGLRGPERALSELTRVGWREDTGWGETPGMRPPGGRGARQRARRGRRCPRGRAGGPGAVVGSEV